MHAGCVGTSLCVGLSLAVPGEMLFASPLLQPLDQSSGYAVVKRLPAGITATMLRQAGPCTPFVTSDASQGASAVVWALERTNRLRLVTLSGDNLNDVLFAGDAGPWNNSKGGAFLEPTISDGQAYVPTSTGVTVLGQ